MTQLVFVLILALSPLARDPELESWLAKVDPERRSQMTAIVDEVFEDSESDGFEPMQAFFDAGQRLESYSFEESLPVLLSTLDGAGVRKQAGIVGIIAVGAAFRSPESSPDFIPLNALACRLLEPLATAEAPRLREATVTYFAHFLPHADKKLGKLATGVLEKGLMDADIDVRWRCELGLSQVRDSPTEQAALRLVHEHLLTFHKKQRGEDGQEISPSAQEEKDFRKRMSVKKEVGEDWLVLTLTCKDHPFEENDFRRSLLTKFYRKVGPHWVETPMDPREK